MSFSARNYGLLPTTPDFSCTYGSASNQTPNVQYAVGTSIGLAFDAIADANRNWNNARDYGLASGNHWSLPNGSHTHGYTTIIKSDNCIRYESEDGYCSGVTKDGVRYSYTKW